jgi:hypothetical protein
MLRFADNVSGMEKYNEFKEERRVASTVVNRDNHVEGGGRVASTGRERDNHVKGGGRGTTQVRPVRDRNGAWVRVVYLLKPPQTSSAC